MITIIIPTRDRLDALKLTLKSYYKQKLVSEIIIVDDNSDYFSEKELDFIINQYPTVKTKFIYHKARMGAAKSRIDGVMAASNEIIVFGEDDAFFSENYVEKLYDFYKSNKNIGVVAGQINYMNHGENIDQAKQRFGNGSNKLELFNYSLLKFNPFAYVQGYVKTPFVHALYLTNKMFYNKYEFDVSYSKGNGYREETDFQLKLNLLGFDNFITNEVKCYHLNIKDVKNGGQRINRFKKIYWTVFYNNYFLNKYYQEYRVKYSINKSKQKAKFIFLYSVLNDLLINPILKKIFK